MNCSLNKFRFVMAAMAVLQIFSNGASASDASEKTLKKVFGLMQGLGAAESMDMEAEKKGNGFYVLAEFENSAIEIELSEGGTAAKTVSRVAKNKQRSPLSWEKKECESKARDFLAVLFGKKLDGAPSEISKQNLTQNRDLWCVSWARRVENIIVRDDFVTVCFNENEGVFGFNYSWDTMVPEFDLGSLFPKKEVLKEARSRAEAVLAKFHERFAAYALGADVSCELMIVTPNKILDSSVNNEYDLLSGEKLNPKLAWVIVFSVNFDRSKAQHVFAGATDVTIFIDAHTGAFIGGQL